jgi:DNA-binding PadR family transcriptional regulator
MMIATRIHFAERARRTFTRGYPSRNPVDLVERGVRSLDEWVRTLDAHRDQDTAVIRTGARDNFVNDDALRFKILETLEHGQAMTQDAIHDLHVSVSLATLRKSLTRYAEDRQLEVSTRLEAGLEVKRWAITKRGRQELAGHRARLRKVGVVHRAINHEETPHNRAINPDQGGA